MATNTGGTCPEIATSLAKLADLGAGATPVQSANVWAGHGMPYLELVGALNLKAGNDSSTAAKQPKEMAGVCNQLAGTTGLDEKLALAVAAGLATL